MSNDSEFAFFFYSLLLFILAANILAGYVKWRDKRNIEKAAFALGDTFYETGVPNTVWKRYARTFHDYERLLHALAENSRRVVLHLAEAYLIGYVAFSLFPYDILLSTAEIAQKLQITEASARVVEHRTRAWLKATLQKEGYDE